MRVVGSVIGHAMAIVMIVLGVKHKDDCPAEPMVPIFLIGKIIKKWSNNIEEVIGMFCA